jgi:hypothetical protein
MANNKRPSLDLGSLGTAAGPTTNPVDKLVSSRLGKANTRVGKRAIQGYFPPDYRTRMKMLSAKLDKSVEALLEEAMDDLFSKHGA